MEKVEFSHYAVDFHDKCCTFISPDGKLYIHYIDIISIITDANKYNIMILTKIGYNITIKTSDKNITESLLNNFHHSIIG